MNPDTACRLVGTGAGLLDITIPDWWRAQRPGLPTINLNLLDLADDCLCVLGQLHPDPQRVPGWSLYGYPSTVDSSTVLVVGFAAGRTALALTEAQALTHGFDALDVDDLALLTAAWRDLIAGRRGRAAGVRALLDTAAGAGGSR